MTNPKVEELLETLYLVEQENAAITSSALETAVIAEARSLGLVRTDDDHPRLTPAGLDSGRLVVRRHRLAERLLNDIIRVNRTDLDADACRFEHIIRDGLEDRICALLGHPRICPHGHAIPTGKCCDAFARDPIREVQSLCDGKPGQEGIVAYLSTRDEREVQKLMAMGILPGVHIKLIRQFPSYIFAMGFSQFTVDSRLAEKIYVNWQAT